MRIVRVLALLGVLIALVATAATAAQIVQTKTFGGIPNLLAPLTFDQYDTTLGALNYIQVTMNLNIDGGQIILDNDSDTPAAGTFHFGALGSISSSDVGLISTALTPIAANVPVGHTGSYSLAPNIGDVIGDYSPLPPDGMKYIGGLETGSGSGNVHPLFWGGYLGTGTYNINAGVAQWFDYGSIGGIEVAMTPVSSTGDVTVVYDFNAVPEASSMMLALSALPALGLIIKRRLA